MPQSEPRFMHRSDWIEASIAQHRYFNRECAIKGYERVGGQGEIPHFVRNDGGCSE